jgi:hypothetical protein
VTNICPGLCVMQTDGRAATMAAWGVTPHAQKTGTSSAPNSAGSPPSGRDRSDIPISIGLPICTDAIWPRCSPLVAEVSLGLPHAPPFATMPHGFRRRLNRAMHFQITFCHAFALVCPGRRRQRRLAAPRLTEAKPRPNETRVRKTGSGATRCVQTEWRSTGLHHLWRSKRGD